jgi:hypothetical protein
MINIKHFFSRFYVDVKSRTNNYHLVHKEGCPFLPEKEKRIYLGVNTSAHNALGEARNIFSSSECCRFCLKEEAGIKKELIYNEICYADNFPVSSLIRPVHEDVMRSYAS